MHQYEINYDINQDHINSLFTSYGQVVIVNEGDTIRLPCFVDDSGEPLLFLKHVSFIMISLPQELSIAMLDK